MTTVGWAAAAIGFLTSLFGVVRLIFEQIPGLSDSAIKAVEALRELWRVIKSQPELTPWMDAPQLPDSSSEAASEPPNVPCEESRP
jgi:hypothetical protein